MEKKPNEKKVLALSFLGVLTFIAVVVGATYAYFTAQGGGTGNINVNATTNTTDNLSFQVGNAISLTANQEDFASGMGNKSGSTTAKAILTANNATNTATRNYYVYLNITSNDFEYTTDDEQAEILLKVTDPEGTEVTTLGSLERKTSGTGDNQVTGFDITTQTGLITIADNYEITSTGTEEQEWKIEVIFANLDSDQNKNTGKSFNANLIIREDSPIGITEVSTSNITSNSITLTVDAESENTITKYYYAKNEEEYVESDSNTYTFSGLDAATSYTLKAYAVDEKGYQSAVYSTEETTADPTLVEICDGKTLSECIITELYTEDGVNDLYYHDGSGTYGSQEAGDGSYRYAGANPNNYVCFGSDAASCPADNLYRIIGVFGNQVKLIKHEYAGSDLLGTNGDFYNASYSGVFGSSSYYKGSKDQSTIPVYYWNRNGTNTWSASQLNTVNLNTNYLNNIGSKWSSLIATTSWKVGGITTDQRSTPPKSVYNYEVGSSSSSTTYSAKVGLMYISDYGYATSPSNWSTNLGSYNSTTVRDNNWMWMGATEWTISRISDDTNYAFGVSYVGYVNNIYVDLSAGVRPSFYLESSVELESGDGTIDSPYRIQAGA